MNEDQKGGKQIDPLALERKSVIDVAAEKFCCACGGRPCYLLTSAALAVFYETFSYNEDHISTDRYEQALAGVHDCLMRHVELIEMRRADNHHPKNNGVYRKGDQSQDLQTDARDPPSLN
jgi:hypothetical protein